MRFAFDAHVLLAATLAATTAPALLYIARQSYLLYTINDHQFNSIARFEFDRARSANEVNHDQQLSSLANLYARSSRRERMVTTIKSIMTIKKVKHCLLVYADEEQSISRNNGPTLVAQTCACLMHTLM